MHKNKLFKSSQIKSERLGDSRSESELRLHANWFPRFVEIKGYELGLLSTASQRLAIKTNFSHVVRSIRSNSELLKGTLGVTRSYSDPIRTTWRNLTHQGRETQLVNTSKRLLFDHFFASMSLPLVIKGFRVTCEWAIFQTTRSWRYVLLRIGQPEKENLQTYLEMMRAKRTWHEKHRWFSRKGHL